MLSKVKIIIYGGKMANASKIKRAIGIGESSIDVFPPPIIAQRAPTTSDNDYPLGQKWIYSSQEYTFMGAGVWDQGGVGAATTTTYGVVLLDDDGTLAGADDDHVPTALAAKTYIDSVAIAGAADASTTTKGIIEIATNTEAKALSSGTLAIVPSNLAAVLTAPGAIGGTTPGAGSFSTLSASGAFSLSGDQVQVAEGGTGASSLTDHGIVLGSGTSAVSVVAVGTDNQVLIGQSAADPVWSNDLDLPGTLDVTGAATLDSTLDVAGAGTFTDQVDVDNININGNTISSTNTNGNINLVPDGTGVVTATELTLTTDLAVAHGGTGASSLTDHSVLVGSGTSAVTALTVGTDGQVLVGSSAADPVFATLASADGTVTYSTGAGTLDLAVTAATTSQAGGLETATDVEAVAVTATDKIIVPANLAAVLAEPPAIGGTTPAAGEFTTVTLADINADYTDHGVLLGQGTDTNLVATSAGTDGQLFVGATSADPAFATAASADSSIAFTLGANTVDFAVDESYLQLATVTISTAELLALATSPKELVAAPGADKIVQFVGATLVLDYNSILYAESGDNMGIKYENAAGVQVSEDIEMTGFIDQTADTVTNAVPKKDAIVAASGCVNKALVMDNLGSNFTNGNSPVDVRIAYRIVTAGL